MARSDISGADGHGVFRLPQYIRRIQTGGINTRPNIVVNRTAPGTALVDGDNGLGALVVSRAVETAIEIAGTQGVGWVGTRHGNHAGAAAVYAAMPVPHDMIGIYYAVGNANHLPPWGGVDMLLSTNPLAIAVPALEEPPLILDMATTVAAYGKVKVAAQQGKTMPEGWMIDRQGKPLTDPNRSDDGFLLADRRLQGRGDVADVRPARRHAQRRRQRRGRGRFQQGRHDADQYRPGDLRPRHQALRRAGAFKRQVDSVIRQLHGSALLPGFDRIRLPGEDRAARIAERTASGIPIPGSLKAALDKMAGELGIKPLL